ncbi:hypothetical protein CEXT_342871 [Caerostris extrusa]|uniref:Uncharacterized protein n=1 Tax=Caerostris extrusa TaxID=172846 RepID=A0AAV4SHS7_CAEEX|nr:hypothetical protein CEXT_342871 [Caerostris extrusa]
MNIKRLVLEEFPTSVSSPQGQRKRSFRSNEFIVPIPEIDIGKKTKILDSLNSSDYYRRSIAENVAIPPTLISGLGVIFGQCV